MSKIIMIRHAEPKLVKAFDKPIKTPVDKKRWPLEMYTHAQLPRFCSTLKRGRQTLEQITGSWKTSIEELDALREWDKELESKNSFIKRVEYGLSLLEERSHGAKHGIFVIGHSRWMVAAHYILKGEIALGFDYLEGFTAEL